MDTNQIVTALQNVMGCLDTTKQFLDNQTPEDANKALPICGQKIDDNPRRSRPEDSPTFRVAY
jgi:hypothetical protein